MQLLMKKTNEIFINWTDCKNSIKGHKNALYKKFNTSEEAGNFIQINNVNTNDQKQVILTMYNRAKFHRFQTQGMLDAMVVYKK